MSTIIRKLRVFYALYLAPRAKYAPDGFVLVLPEALPDSEYDWSND